MKFNIVAVFVALLSAVTLVYAGFTTIHASDTSNFTQTINAGTLAVDIVDASYVTVASPTMAMAATSFSTSCQTPGTDGDFGTSTEQIYVNNPDAADNGWSVTLAASNTTDLWDSAGTDFDFNDPGGSGCTDGGDTDSFGGQMTVNATGGTLATGQCGSCTTTGVSLGSSGSYDEGTTDSITIVTGASGSDDIGDWTVQNVDIDQTIPANQPAASDYNIDMVLTIASS